MRTYHRLRQKGLLPFLSCVWADCRQRPEHSNNKPFLLLISQARCFVRPTKSGKKGNGVGGIRLRGGERSRAAAAMTKKTWRAFSYPRGGRKPDREKKPIFAILTKMRKRIRAALVGSHFPDAKRLCFPPPAIIFLKLIFWGFLASDYNMHVSSDGVSILPNQLTFYLSSYQQPPSQRMR